MDYLKRFAEGEFKKLDQMFPVVLVCGPRQIGKTTMLQHLAEATQRTYVSLDDLEIRELALSDPKLFFQKYKTPILIDEVQFAPNLFTYIKIMVDEHQQSGEFWLTGSQSYNLMKGVTESLAGRIGVLNMFPMLHQEVTQSFLPLPQNFDFNTLTQIKTKTLEINDVFQFIFHGGMPKTINYDDEQRALYYNSYINTYLMRDIMQLGKITDVVKFNKFLVACASQIAQVVNYANLAMVVGISQPTAKEWLELLQGLGIVYLVRPYFNNALKRLSKTPKLYFYDTGLCAYLARIPSADSLAVSSFAGSYFENFVMNQFQVKLSLTANSPQLYFYRDIDQNEVDILLETFDGLIPLEIKLTASPTKNDFNKFTILQKLGRTIKSGGIICLINNLLPATEQQSFIPVCLI